MKRIGEILVGNGWIEPAVLERALAKQRELPHRLCSLLIAGGAIDVDQASRALGEQLGCAAVLQKHLDHRDHSLVALIPAELARAWWVLPIGRLGNGDLIVCARDPRPSVLEALQAVLSDPIVLAVAPAAQVERLVAQSYGAPDEDFEVDMSTGPIASLDLDPLPDEHDPMASLGSLELVELDDHGVTRDPTQSGLLQLGAQQRVSPLSSVGLRVPPTHPPPTAPRPDIVVIDPPTRPPGKRAQSEPVMIIDTPPSREVIAADAARPPGKTAAEQAAELAAQRAAVLAAQRTSELAAREAERATREAAELAAREAIAAAAREAATLAAREAAALVAREAAEKAAREGAAREAAQQAAADRAAQQAAAEHAAAQQAAAANKSPAERAAELAAQLPAEPSGPARLLARPEPPAAPVVIRPRRQSRPPIADVTDDGWEAPDVEARPSAGTRPPPIADDASASPPAPPAPPGPPAPPAVPAAPVVARPAASTVPRRITKAIEKTMPMPRVIRPAGEPTTPPPLKKPPPVHAITRPTTSPPITTTDPPPAPPRASTAPIVSPPQVTPSAPPRAGTAPPESAPAPTTAGSPATARASTTAASAPAPLPASAAASGARTTEPALAASASSAPTAAPTGTSTPTSAASTTAASASAPLPAASTTAATTPPLSPPRTGASTPPPLPRVATASPPGPPAPRAIGSPAASAEPPRSRIDADRIASAYASPPPAYDGKAIAAGTARPQRPLRRTHSPPANMPDTLAALASVTTRDDATAAALRFARGRWRACLLVEIREKSALGEAGHGLLLTEDVVASLAIPLAAPSIIALALEARALTTDLPRDDSPVQDRLDRLLGMPRFPAAAPVLLGGAPAFVIVIGDPTTDDTDAATSDLDRLATALAGAYARVTAG